ncbi:MAG: twin-arginine translocase TatA/TatE family subunit [Planctomycetes bacterium]|nr:twin-arginine translocase TatA/TatE family subunit [Planctomycetota bacterium]
MTTGLLINLGFLSIFQQIGWFEWLIIAVIAILLFGKRLPDIGRQLGKGMVEFKKGLKGMQEELEKAGEEVKDTGAPVAHSTAEKEADAEPEEESAVTNNKEDSKA